MRTFLRIFLLLTCAYSYAQITVKGTVTDQYNLPISEVNVTVIDGIEGAVTNINGNFTFIVNQIPPFSIIATRIGFESLTKEVTADLQYITFVLKEGTRLDQIVISASRTPERIFESPVTVERFDISDIKNTTSIDFYDGLENLKGVDIHTNSLTFKSINTRGFSSFSNTRFLQLIDGMDNAIPALSFALGNLVGMAETDILSVELLPGPASALYGANAFNGVLFMRSKNPFDFQGISGYYKKGITSQDASGDNTYTDFGIRAAYKFSNRFAAKINFSYLKGTDWAADNTTGKPGTGQSRADPDYDGINVYGDEVSTNINGVAQSLVDLGILPPGADAVVPSVNVSRTGYNEIDLTDYNAESIKTDWGLFYRPWEDDFEIVYVSKIGGGSTIFQGTNRFALEDFEFQQHKLEVRDNNFFLRGYLTSDKAGGSYDMLFTGINVNRAWKDDQTWFGEYVGAFVRGTLDGLNPTEAHLVGRQTADTGRFEPGSLQFVNAFNTIINDPDLTTGSRFQDNSKIYRGNGNYNFSHLTDFAEIQIGGSYDDQHLNSSGTIYTDADGTIKYSSFSFYSQIQKTFLEEDRLKFTGSLRYDKSELFDGFFSPRIALGYTAGADKDHNIRVTYQTGFRNPTSQNLFLGVDVGRAILIGSASNNPERFSREHMVSAPGQGLGFPARITQTGEAVFKNSFSAASVQAFATTGDPTKLQIGNPKFAKPEKIRSFEIGYRGKLKRMIIDISIFHNQYKDFISNVSVIAPLYGEVGDNSLSIESIINGDFVAYQTFSNSAIDVSAFGGSIGIHSKVFGDFDLSGSYSFIRQDFDKDKFPDFETNFNTPEHKMKVSFGNPNLFKNLGFNIAWRWSDTYFWEAPFGDGDIPAFHVIDAQMNLRVPALKSTLKAGVTNLLGDEYFTAFGSGFIGSQYYVSITIL